MKPREWTIQIKHDKVLSGNTVDMGAENVKVVEYSAYEELCNYNDGCKKKRYELAKETDKLAKQLVALEHEYSKLSLELDELKEYCTPSALAKFKNMNAALNKIGMLAMGEMGHTSDFTGEVQSIVREALCLKEKW